MSPEHQRIVNLGDRTYVEGVYSIVNPQLAQTRNNKPYLKCIIRDASGEISGRAWSFEEAQFDAVSATGFVFLLAGNLVGTGRVIAFLFGMEPIPGIWICCLAVWLYTIAGGECL